jgi:hypothetical protein
MTDEHAPLPDDDRDGGADEPDTGDPTSVTGGSGIERGEHVGRAAGSDVGYAGETGAERRAAAADDGA